MPLTTKRLAGYTLIEVLVAMLILALSLTVLLRIFSTGLRNITVADDYTRALLIARTQLEAVATSGQLANGSTVGVAEQKFSWTRTVEDYNPFANTATRRVPLRAFAVTVEVEWPGARSDRRISLHDVYLGEKSAP